MRDYIIRQTDTSKPESIFGKFICHLDDSKWRDYTALWELTIDDMLKTVNGLGGRITSWDIKDNQIILRARF